MRYLDTRALGQMGPRPVGARPRRFIWLVWMLPHLVDGPRHAAETDSLRWPVYLRHGGAA